MEIVGLNAIEYTTDYSGTPTLYLFCRDQNGKRTDKVIRNFKPYFYVPVGATIPDDIKSKITTEKVLLKTLDNREVVKLLYTNPKDTYIFRDKFIEHFTADLPFHLRFSIDQIDKIIPSRLRIHHLDIETTMKNGFPTADTALQNITAISIYDTFDDRLTTFAWHETPPKDRQDDIFWFNNEIDMLKEFVKYEIKSRPDVWSAWNLNRFDAPYLIARLKKVGLWRECNSLSQIGKVYVAPRDGAPIIAGIGLVDLFYWYKRLMIKDLSSYSLNNVAQETLGESKLEDVRDPDLLWRENPAKLVQYNRQDVILVKKLDEKLKIIDQVNELRLFASVNFQDVVYYSRLIDIFLMRRYKNKFIFPTKPPYDENNKTHLEGGYVAEPKIGLHENVILLDVSAMYPSIIRSFNLSFDTCASDGDIDINGVKFTTKHIGMLPSILDEMIALRMKYKEEMKKYPPGSRDYDVWFAKQFSCKFFINTCYGAFALSSFRFYKPEIAATITYLGRELIKYCVDRIEKEKLGVVLYNDTDSCFVKPTANDTIVAGKQIVEFLNTQIIDEFVQRFGIKKHCIQFTFDKYYSKVVLVAKKRYVGKIIWKEGETVDLLDNVGMSGKRSDFSKCSQKIQSDIYIKILEGESKEKIIEHIVERIQAMSGTTDFVSIALPTKINHNIDGSDGSYKNLNILRVRAALWSNKYLGTNFSVGSKAYLLFTDNGYTGTDVIMFNYADQLKDIKFKLNIEKMTERNILMPLDSLFTALNWQDELKKIRTSLELKSKGQQTLMGY